MPRALQAEAPSRRRRDDALEEFELQALPARLRTVLLYGVLAWQSNLMEPVTEKCSSEAESDGIGRAEIRREMLMQMAPGAKAERESQRKRSVKRCIGQISCVLLCSVWANLRLL